MKKIFRTKRLKIAEQILIVLFCSVLIPMIISAIIINNINQQAMRAQLRDSAILISNMVSEELDMFVESSINELTQIETIYKIFKTQKEKNSFVKQILKKTPAYSDLRIINNQDSLNKFIDNNLKNQKMTIYIKTSDNRFLTATYSYDVLKNKLFQSLKDDKRQIYVISTNQDLVAAHNYTENAFLSSIKFLPNKMTDNLPQLFGNIDNQPMVYFKKTNPNVLIIVNTTAKVTKKTINENAIKLLLAVCLASLSVFILVAIYIYYLYINIRQLFKGIIAVSKGSYERRIRLLTSVFTPYEIIFLAFKFNKMAKRIHKSYIQLKKQNEELKKLNDFRSNLIDTVSHELRTPLTSIQGYTSRLLRQDIQIDEETKIKSLKVIKKQSDRLKRMIEDLLIIPDIERSRINIKFEAVWLPEVISTVLLLIDQNRIKDIDITVPDDIPFIKADKDRVEQIIVNLLENAIKYATPDTKIIVDSSWNDKYVTIYIKNDCEIIPKNKLNKLFEKFTRIDDKKTKVTKGTGLGLFIVKGLVENMNGKINLYSNEKCGFCIEIKMPIYKD